MERKRGIMMSGSVVGIFGVCLFTSQWSRKQTGSGPSYKPQDLLPVSHFLYLEILSGPGAPAGNQMTCKRGFTLEP